jgi:hypothetical protein
VGEEVWLLPGERFKKCSENGGKRKRRRGKLRINKESSSRAMR